MQLLSLFTAMFLLSTVDSLFMPVSRVLSKKKPHSIELLGKDLVLWWDRIKWRATSDICPHRHGSFSSGVITPNGDIKCGYHGWEFNGCGKSTYIPELRKTEPVSIPKYDLIENEGVLWINHGEKNHSIDSISHLSKNNVFTEWMIHELDTKHDLFLENGVDFPHFHHVHHGVIPFLVNRYKKTVVANEDDITVHWYNQTGFKVSMGKNDNSPEFTFYPPYSIHFDLKMFSIWLSCVPISENKTSVFSNILVPFKNKWQKRLIKFFYFLTGPINRAFGNKILRQDMRQLKDQNRNVKKLGKKKYIYNYVGYKPIELYNKWNNEFGNTTSFL